MSEVKMKTVNRRVKCPHCGKYVKWKDLTDGTWILQKSKKKARGG